MVKKIKELLSNGNDLNIVDERDDNLNTYITTKAKEYLQSKNGAIEDSIVLGWARHFYIESQEDINKEILELSPVKKEVPTPALKKEKKIIETIGDKGEKIKVEQLGFEF